MGARVGRSITPRPRLALTLHQPFHAFKHELTCFPVGLDNWYKPEIQAEGITALVRQADIGPSVPFRVRQQQSAPLLAELRERLLVRKRTAAAQASHGGGDPLCSGTMERVECICSDGAVPIDNNVSEREMKRVVLNRKNSLFAGNLRGGPTAAILASLTSTCRRHEIDPQLYLTQLLINPADYNMIVWIEA